MSRPKCDPTTGEARENHQLPRYTRSDPCRSKHGRPQCDPTTGEAQCYYSCCGICCTPNRTCKCGTRPFLRSGRRAGAHTRPAWPKIPTAPSALPLLGAPGKNPPPGGGKSLREGRPPEPGGNLQLPRHINSFFKYKGILCIMLLSQIFINVSNFNIK